MHKSGNVKRRYTKPTLVKRETLSQITAGVISVVK